MWVYLRIPNNKLSLNILFHQSIIVQLHIADKYDYFIKNNQLFQSLQLKFQQN